MSKSAVNGPDPARTCPIKQQLVEAQFEYPDGSNNWFVPNNIIRSLVNKAAVERELRSIVRDPTVRHQHAQKISSTSQKIFAILLRSKTVCEATLSYVEDTITDADLPFCREGAKDGSYILCKKSHQPCHKAEHLSCGIHSMSTLPQDEILDLERVQWWVQAPEFRRRRDRPDDIPHLELGPNIVMPFTKDHWKENHRKGGYSEVWSVRIHPAHQDILESEDPLGPLVAVKRLMSGDLKDFKLETDFLRDLSKRKHPHLVQLLATYKIQEKYHLIFPYAQSNLRQNWKSIGLPYWNNPTALWFLRQVQGLVSALNAIHNFNTGGMQKPLNVQTASTSSTRYQTIQIKVENEQYGRHGDLKPENILWFNDGTGAGILQIADFGLGRFHRLESRSLQDWRIPGSPTYTPPEIFLQLKVRREYDIWSLGCIFLEFITWLLEGSDGLDQFDKMRRLKAADQIEDDVYYTLFYPGDDPQKTPDDAEVRKGVTQWIRRLRTNSRCSKMSLQFLDLIEEKMILVDSKKRITAKSLANEVDQMLEEGESNPRYLLGDNAAVIDGNPGVKEPVV